MNKPTQIEVKYDSSLNTREPKMSELDIKLEVEDNNQDVAENDEMTEQSEQTRNRFGNNFGGEMILKSAFPSELEDIKPVFPSFYTNDDQDIADIEGEPQQTYGQSDITAVKATDGIKANQTIFLSMLTTQRHHSCCCTARPITLT